MNSEFIYLNGNSDEIWSRMSNEEKKTFPFEVRNVNWDICLPGFSFGIRRYFLREDCIAPVSTSGFNQILYKNQIRPLHDMRVATDFYGNFVHKDLSLYFDKILRQENF